jgi:hypothetical protein
VLNWGTWLLTHDIDGQDCQVFDWKTVLNFLMGNIQVGLCVNDKVLFRDDWLILTGRILNKIVGK